MSANMNRIYSILSFILFLPFFGNSQQLPVSATTILNTPHPVYVNEYYSIGSNALQGIVVLNDLNEPSWDVRLLVTIEGEGIKIKTKGNFLPSNPINLTSGIPLILEGSDFAQYLDVNNVDLEGITAATFNQSGKLPEGIYNFCIEVVDYISGVPLSLPSCAPAFIFFEPPPVTLQPECEGVVTPSDPQIVNFSWQIAGGASPTIAINSKYKLSVYEVTEEGSDPYFAVANNHALLVYESDFINQTQSQIDFGITSTTLLAPGKQYVYRVRAVDGDEKDIYRNNGFSEWCWFFYGYPHDGNLTISAPEDEHIYSKFESKSFVWEVSDLGIPGQEYNYAAIIKVLNEGQNKEDAMDTNPDWYVKNMPTTSSLNGYAFTLDQNTEPGVTYVWQVIAYTGAQEVAKSEIYTFYSAPLVDHFMAGPSRVEVVSLLNNQLEDLSGVGRIQVTANEADVIEFEFEHLNIRDLGGGDYALMDGEASLDLSNLEAAELEPNLGSNGPANFSFTLGRVNNSGIQTKGIVSWQFPHATTSGQIEFIESEEDWFALNSNYQLNGTSELSDARELELLEPYEFIVSLQKSSIFQISNGKYSLSFSGGASANTNVKTNNGEPYTVYFSGQPSLYYFEVNSLLSNATNYLKPSDGLEIGFMPKQAVIDLSEETSPGKLSGTPGWKGFYFPEFQVKIYPGETDATGQLSVSQIIGLEEDQTNSDFWLENQGLNLRYDYVLAEEGITFNGFATEITGNFNVEDNQITNSKITGEIKIPVIDKTDGFGFEIPVTNDGLAQGYLYEDLTQREMVFNPYGGENRVDITINRAVFAENERLDLEIDADLTGISALVSGINDFRVYGDNTIGIGSKNGSKALDTQVEGEYKGFVTYVQEVGAALFNGNYVFSYIAALDMGDDVVGEDGPPLLAISSVEEVGGDVVLPNFSPTNPQPEPAISVPADIEPGSPTLTTYEMFIAVDNVIVNLEGYLKLSNNDPTWGTSFRGGINGSLKIPTQIDVGANMIFGDRDGLKFWYFDAYFNDREGLGIPVPPLFNIVAMEGKIYHHMSKNETEYVIDEDMAFGAGLYMQMIDNQTGGSLFAVDVGAEIKIQESGDFTISMNGDASFINTNKRSAVSGGMTSAVGDVIIEEALEAIGPISLTFSVGGGDLTVEAEGLTKGSMEYTKGDMTFGFDAELGSTPGIGFNYSKGAGNLSFNANASGTFGLGLGLDGNELSLGIEGTSVGYLDLSYDDVSFATRINRVNKTGTLAFAYGDMSIDFGVETDGGYLNLAVSSDLIFNTGFNTAGSAYLGIVSGSNEFSISGDKTTGAGELALKVDGVEMNLAANTLEKSAFFGLNTGALELNVGGQVGKSGLFNLKEGGNEYDLAVDLETNSGNIGYIYNGGNDYFKVDLENGENGSLSFKNGEHLFNLYGNASGTAGGVSYVDGSNEFSINADIENKSGDLTLVFPGNSLIANLNMDSSFVNYEGEGLKLGVSGKIGESGYMLVDNGDFMINMGANMTENSGMLKFQTADFLVDVGANKTAGTGRLLLETADLQSSAIFSNEEKSVSVSSGNVSFSGSVDQEETGRISLSTGDMSIGLGANIGQKRGILNFEQGGNIVAIDLEAINGTGSMLFDIEGNKVEATSNEEELSAAFEMDNFSLSLLANKLTGDGLASVSSGGTTVSIGRVAEGNFGTLGFEDGTRSIAVSASVESRAGSITIEDPEVNVALNVTPEGGTINVEKDEHAVSLTGNSDGTGSIGYSNGDITLGFDGDIPNKEGTVSYSKGDFGISIMGNAESKAGSITATKADNTYIGEFTTSSGKLTYQTPDYEVSASANTSYEAEGSVEISGNKITIGGNTQNKTAFMQYENGPFSIQINNEKMVTLTYNENEVSFSIDAANNVQFLSAGEYLELAQNAGEGTKQLDYGPLQLEAVTNSEGASLVASYEGVVEVTASVDYEKNGSIDLKLAGQSFNVSKDGDLMTVGYNENQLNIDNSSINLSLENGQYLSASIPEGLAFSLGETEFFLDKDHPISIGEGANVLTFSPEFVQFDNNDNSFKLTSEKVVSLNIGTDKSISISPTDVEIQYEDKNIAFGTSKYLEYSDLSNNFKLTNESIEVGFDGNTLELKEDYLKASYDGTKSIEISPELFGVTFDEYELAFGTARPFYYKSPTRVIDFENDGLILEAGSVEFQIKDDLIKFTEGGNKSISVSQELVELVYEDKTISFGAEKSLGYTDSENVFELSEEGLNWNSGEKSIAISDGKFDLAFSSEDYVSIASTGLSFGYAGLAAEIKSEGSFTLTEGDNSFELTTTGLAISSGDKGISLQNEGGTPEIKLQNGEDSFELSSAGFAVEYDGERYAINDEENLKINTSENGYIEVMNNGAKYVEGETELIIGGDDNFLELKSGTKSIALTQDQKLAFVDGNYSASLSKTLEIEMSDGIRTIGLFTPTHYVSYVQGDYAFGIRGGSGGNKPGVDVTAFGHTLFVEGERGKDVTVGVSSPDFGDATFSIDAQKNIESRFISGADVYGFIKDEAGITPITGTEPVPPEPEYLEGSGTVEAMDGPSHLTNSIADEGGGSIRGQIELSYDSKNSRFVANAAVKGNEPVCIEGALALDVSPDNFVLNIGTEEQRIEIFPTCSGFGGGGWFGLESNSTATKVDIGIFVGWSAKAGVEIGGAVCGAGLSVEASAELGVKAKADILPEFHLNEAGIWLDLYVAIKANYWAVGVTGSLTLAEAGLSGELLAKFLDDETEVSGNLSGYITILEIISASFDMSFSTSF